jgi:hypothetical protein
MSKVSAKNAVILIGGYNLSTYLTNYEVQENQNPIDMTGFTDGAQNYIPGLPTANITGSAMWDNSTDTATPVLKSYTGTTTDGHVTILLEGGTAGNASVSMPFTLGGITPSGSPTGGIMLGTLNFSSYGDNEGVENGQVLHHGEVTNSTTDEGVLDALSDGAVTARCSATLHIWKACASDTYAVAVEDSDDCAVYANLLTFTLTGAAVGSERIEVASDTLNKYRRVVATRTGSAGDSFGFSVHFWRDNTATT